MREREPARRSLKPSRASLNSAGGKLFISGAVLLTAHASSAGLQHMNRILAALIVSGALAAFAPLAEPAAAAAPLPQAAGGAVPSLAPMLARITPGVVNIAVRGKVREQ